MNKWGLAKKWYEDAGLICIIEPSHDGGWYLYLNVDGYIIQVSEQEVDLRAELQTMAEHE